ncbi:hypothetical protein SAURM35S_00706 [Streptomyces aurantiogriseus]
MPLVAALWVSSRGTMSGSGLLSRSAQQLGDAVLHVLRGVADGTALGRRRAVLREVVERELEPPGLAERALLGRLRGVDDRVEDGPPDVLGEQVGVHAAEFGAVGDAEVVQLRVAEDPAHQVHVAGRVGGAHMRQHPLRVVLAGLVELLRVVQERRALGGVVGGHVLLEVGVELLVVLAADGGAAADAARVEAHEVVAGAQGRVVLAERGQRGDAGAAGAAEVEQQRADPSALRTTGLRPDQRDVDRVALGVVPVQGCLHGGALPLVAVRQGGRRAAAALRLGRGGAALPVQLLCRQILVPGIVAAAGHQRPQQDGGRGQGGGAQAGGAQAGGAGHDPILGSRPPTRAGRGPYEVRPLWRL